jgi:hypothetical protein
MREPVCAVKMFVSINGRHLTKLFLTTRFLSEMPAEEARSKGADVNEGKFVLNIDVLFAL